MEKIQETRVHKHVCTRKLHVCLYFLHLVLTFSTPPPQVMVMGPLVPPTMQQLHSLSELIRDSRCVLGKGSLAESSHAHQQTYSTLINLKTKERRDSKKKLSKNKKAHLIRKYPTSRLCKRHQGKTLWLVVCPSIHVQGFIQGGGGGGISPAKAISPPPPNIFTTKLL